MNTLTLSAIGAAIILAVLAAVYYQGNSDGVDAERAAVRQQSLDALRERKKLDERYQGASGAELCAGLGGVWRDNECR